MTQRLHHSSHTRSRTLWTRLKCLALAAAALCVSAPQAQTTSSPARTIIPAMSAPLQLKAGVVENNVFTSLAQAGVPDEVALTLVRELSQVMHLDASVKSGNRFAVLYEKKSLLSTGQSKLLAFEYSNDVTVYAAYWFDQSGSGAQSGYYQEDGVSLRPAFLRTPIEIVKVSSNYGARKHPIHKTWLTHEGTDFAAPTGTRIFASSDGEVTFIGTQNGFGKVIKLKHPQDTQTVYAHMSVFKPDLKVGDTVKQGDVIGFVGATGWATGPHLHYEYRVVGKPIDPFSAAVPVTNRIPPEQTDMFAAQMDSYKTHFSLLNPRRNVVKGAE
jgi:murein DD-endopeptidase MepM/ murein hydrolase activator NlpD